MSSGHFLSSLEPRFSSLTVWCHACMLSLFSRVQLFVMPWTAIHQAPLSMGFSRQEYWIGLPCSPPGVLLDPGIKPESLMSPALADRFFTPRASWGTTCCVLCLVTQSCLTLRSRGLQPARLLCPWGFSRQEYWSGSPCPPSWDLPNPGIEPRSPTLQADSLLSEPPRKPS